MPDHGLTALTINLMELGVAALLALFFWAAQRPAQATDPLRWAARITRKRGSATAVIVAATLGAAVLASVLKPAVPRVHDEFCYLLTADTFAAGRATNPTHPLWPHFETFHTIHAPSYQAKYPPGQALFLAAGQILTGHPIVGVWASMIAASLALYWCLGAWMPRSWALLGALIPCIRFGTADLWISSYWMYWSASFWGGGVALLGAALMTGALPRLWRGSRITDAALLGVGISLLAVSRPFEGLLAACVVAVFLFRGLLRRLTILSTARVLLPTLVVVSVAAGLLGYYHRQVTGSPTTFPYSIYTEDYDRAPLFAFLDLGTERSYRHREMEEFHTGFSIDIYHEQQRGLAFTPFEWVFTGRFFVGPALGLITVLGFWWRRPWGYFCVVMMIVGVISHQVSSSNPLQPHYFAPFVPTMLLLTLRGLRLLRVFAFRGRAVGRYLVSAVLLTSLAVYGFGVVLRYSHDSRLQPFGIWRDAMHKRLAERSGNQLVIVRYREDHNPHYEWVFNRADIDAAKVVWAREMDPASNQRLLEYFSDREAWLIEPDISHDRLTPYRR